MKIKFNKFERVAGLFVLFALLGAFIVTVSVAIKKGWFSSKIEYVTEMESAEGLNPGTLVQVAGLRAGKVKEVDLLSVDKVRVRFEVLEKFQNQIRQDSEVQVLRPFVIGEKVLEISVGSASLPVLKGGSSIQTVSSFDIMDIFSGRQLGPVLGTFEQLTQNFKVLAEAFADPERTKAMVQIFDRLDPLLNNLNKMSVEVTKTTGTFNQKQRLETALDNLSLLTMELNKVLATLTPAIEAVAPDLPQTSLRAVEALDETVILLKALQNSFMLRGRVRDVREQEEKERRPANDE